MIMNQAEEVPLAGGNVNSIVVRAGDTVRRGMNASSPAIHSLLKHLESLGFRGCPRFLGIDAQEREILTYLSGDVGPVDDQWGHDASVRAAARLLRQYHDATVGFDPPRDAVWGFVYPDPHRHEVICHNDFAPYNLIYANGVPYAMIDFDMAGPGPRLRDVAYACYWFAPLCTHDGLSEHALNDVKAGSRRLRIFCEEYGVPANSELLDMVESVIQFLADWLEEGGDQGDAACRKMIADGHLEVWRRAMDEFRRIRPSVEVNLGR